LGLGLRRLDPAAPGFRGRHRSGSAERDRAYHQGTVWPWLVGPLVDAEVRTGGCPEGLLDGLVATWASGAWGRCPRRPTSTRRTPARAARSRPGRWPSCSGRAGSPRR